MSDFAERIVGASLLSIVSRGQALIAELLRLSDHVPSPFIGAAEDQKYTPLLFDFKYFRSPELEEERIEVNAELTALDDEFRDAFSPILYRFFLLFRGIAKYHDDLLHFLQDLQEETYVEGSLEMVMENEDGSQLLVEAIFLHAVLLFLLEHRMKGDIRERLLVAYVRIKGISEIPKFESLCMLCRSSSAPSSTTFPSMATFAAFLQSSPPPVPSTMLMLDKPEELLARFPLPKTVITTILERIQSNDLYNQLRHYPSPEHRGTALSAQAACLCILLFYVPQILHNDSSIMHELVDRFFKDSWVIPIYMGFMVDLSVVWARFKAAKASLSTTLSASSVRDTARKHSSKVRIILADLNAYLSEGVLTQEYVLNNVHSLVSCIRDCNVTLRWLLLHRITASRKLRDIVITTGDSQSVNEEVLLSLMLDISRLELELKQVYGNLLEKKEMKWQQYRVQAAECMQELSDFFSGAQALFRKIKDATLQGWFSEMSTQVASLDYKGTRRAARNLQNMIAALCEVEKFHQIEKSLQAKQYLSETRNNLQEMLRLLNVQESILATISLVSDAAYAWGLIGAFTKHIHMRIHDDPFTVLKLQSLFLKLRSIMDIPLLRISQSGSEDIFSVSEYYSSELVAYVRKVLEIIPVSIFTIIKDVAKISYNLHDIPGRLEKESLRSLSQLEEHYFLAKARHQVAVFSKGIMAMSRTFIGVIELDPMQLLEDGIRKLLYDELASELQSIFVFTTGKMEEIEEKLNEALVFIQSQKKCMEHFQDYVNIHGLQLWQEEFKRLICFSTEQECRHYSTNKFQEWLSAPKSKAMSFSRVSLYNKDNAGQSKSNTFLGRIVDQLFHLTDPRQSMYLAPLSGWFAAGGEELVGMQIFTILQESLGPIGMMGIDRLLSFVASTKLQELLSALHNHADATLTERLEFLETALHPTSVIPDTSLSIYKEVGLGTGFWETWIGVVAHIGQIQLLRCLIASQLSISAKVDSNLVSYALRAMSKAIHFDTIKHTKNITDKDEANKSVGIILSHLREEEEASGLLNPLRTVYLSSTPPDHFALIAFLATISQLPRYVPDDHLCTLASKMKKATLDFRPLLAGFATLFQQFHLPYAVLYVEYLAQYVRTLFDSIHVPSNSASTKFPDDLPEVKKATVWIFTFLSDLRIPFNCVENLLPPVTPETNRK